MVKERLTYPEPWFPRFVLPLPEFRVQLVRGNRRDLWCLGSYLDTQGDVIQSGDSR